MLKCESAKPLPHTGIEGRRHGEAAFECGQAKRSGKTPDLFACDIL
jgi:hypothetical protein